MYIEKDQFYTAEKFSKHVVAVTIFSFGLKIQFSSSLQVLFWIASIN